MLKFAPVFILTSAFAAQPQTSQNPIAHIDHILVGISDLETGMQAFQSLTGVKPVYGGKHPTGTHNALVSIGTNTYLELIAPQPDSDESNEMIPFLRRLNKLTPIGWAVSGDSVAIEQALSSAGFKISPLEPGSRITPSGDTLRWETFSLVPEVSGGPFFISWNPKSPHPSSTSPAGCVLNAWSFKTATPQPMERLQKALHVPIQISNA